MRYILHSFSLLHFFLSLALPLPQLLPFPSRTATPLLYSLLYFIFFPRRTTTVATPPLFEVLLNDRAYVCALTTFSSMPFCRHFLPSLLLLYFLCFRLKYCASESLHWSSLTLWQCRICILCGIKSKKISFYWSVLPRSVYFKFMTKIIDGKVIDYY